MSDRAGSFARDRRSFLGAALGLVSLPFANATQARSTPRIGWLAPRPGDYRKFLGHAKALGYVEGNNLLVEYREVQDFASGKGVAEELVRARIDLFVAQGPIALQAAMTASRTIPIIACYIGDPIRMGIVKSMARPEGNVTGFTWDAGVEWTGRALQLIVEVVGRPQRIALLWNLENDSHPFYLEEFAKHARTLGVTTLPIGVRRAEEFESAFRRIAEARAGAVILFTDPFTIGNRDALAALLERHPIPSMWGNALWPLAGTLITYGPSLADQPQRLAQYVDRILKGARPRDLPFQQPTTFDLIVDRKKAKALGLTVPASVLARASQVVD